MSNYLNQSDEDFLRDGFPDIEDGPIEEEEVVEKESFEEEPEDLEEEEYEEVGTQDSEEEDQDGNEEEEFEASDTPYEDGGEAEEATEEPEQEDTEPASDDVDYKAVYEKVFAPFRANGREMKVESPEDAISLMQMGANYNKKMAALKPNLRMLKMLDNHGLLDESKLAYLIDLDKKDPGAISKLVKDSGVDLYDLDTEEASEYKPNTYTVSDKEMELDTVLSELEGTPTYNRTLDVVSTKWDVASRKEVANTPQILRVINEHIGNGIFDLVTEEVEKERTFGRLTGISDLEAYKAAGDAIQARGGFNHLVPEESRPAPVRKRVAPKRNREDTQVQNKRRAAGSTRSSAPSRKKNEYDPLAMSDEDFEKLMGDKFL